MKKLLILAVLLTTSPAFSQQTKVERQPLAQPGAQANQGPVPFTQGDNKPASAEAQALLLCQTQQIMGSSPATPSAAGPNYQPGVDAYGRPVAPADGGNTTQFAVPDQIDIPLNVKILETVGIHPSPDLSTSVGNVTIMKDGRVLYNGQNVTATVQDFCKKHSDTKVTQ